MPAEKILIVEDKKLAANVMKDGLEKLGYSVADTASTGEEAIRMAEQYIPDLVLMDIHLRGPMNGIEAAKQIRSGSNIPVIFVTGDKDENLMERSKAAEPLNYVIKPFSFKELQATIETSLNYYRSVHKRIRESLESMERRYHDLFENAIQGMFRISQSGRFMEVNTGFAKLLGYDSPGELLDSAGDVKHHFNNPERHRALIKTLNKSGSVKDFEFEAYRKDGTRIWLSQNTRKIPGEDGSEPSFEGIVHDISERKSAEKSLKSLRKS